MAFILKFPDKRLRVLSEEITEFDQSLSDIIFEMTAAMRDVKGIGLSAPQIGVHKQIVVIDHTPENEKPFVIINPKIISTEGEKKVREGCLSFPGIFDMVTRAESVDVCGFDETGKSFGIRATGLMAQCLQHEIDHLNGVLFIDKMTTIRSLRVKKAMKQRNGYGN